jgi:hypothetical protein
MGEPRWMAEGYNGLEASVAANSITRQPVGDYFQVSKAPIPMGAVPIVDDDRDTVVGYRRVVEGNTWTCDLEGHLLSIEEPGLGTPLIDPLDAIFIVGAIGRIAVRGAFRAGLGVAEEIAGEAAAGAVRSTVGMTLRFAFRRLVQRELRFTATTAARMADPARYVPIDILKLAVRYGARDADPQGVAGAFRYTVPMLKAAKRLGEPPRRYVLRVIVRERDWTILHFHYDR